MTLKGATIENWESAVLLSSAIPLEVYTTDEKYKYS